jgi:hypothetical protein
MRGRAGRPGTSLTGFKAFQYSTTSHEQSFSTDNILIVDFEKYFSGSFVVAAGGKWFDPCNLQKLPRKIREFRQWRPIEAK